jgi:hypothetical protein
MADSAIKNAVGYGFDASLRKGTQNGLAAMRGSNEYQKLDSKGKDAAEKLFKDRIDSDTNLKQFRGIGDDKVSVYRKAAKEIPSRAIDYKKEFGPKAKPAVAKPTAVKSKPSVATAKPTPTPPKASAKYVKRDMGDGMYTYDEVKVAPSIAPPKSQPNAGVKSAVKQEPQLKARRDAPKAAPKVDKTPLPQPDMGFRPFAKADKPKPQAPRSTGTGMSQMLNIKTMGGQYIKKKP